MCIWSDIIRDKFKINPLSKEKRKANLLLIRDTFTEKSTTGKFYLDGEFYAHSLELAWKDNEKRVSCIPIGVYKLRKRKPSESQKYKYEHLEILDVPNRTKILLHIGNYANSLNIEKSDTTGCILLGNTRALNFVGESKKAFYKLMYDLVKYEKLELIIKNR
jgi:hypothetical protein